MSSTTSRTSKIRSRARRVALLAAAAAVAGSGIAASASSAFADGCTGSACSSYTGSIQVGSNLTLFPSTGTFGTVQVAADGTQHQLGQFVLDVDSTDSAGAILSVSMPANPADLTVGMFATDRYDTSGTKGQAGLVSAGVPVTVYAPGNITGHLPLVCPANVTGFAGGECSAPSTAQAATTLNGTTIPGSSDVIDLGTYVQVPTGTPGTANAGSATEFDYALLGS